MKRVFILLIAMSLGFMACNKNKEIGPGTLNVSIVLPADFSSYDKTKIDVYLMSVISKDTISSLKTDVEGKVIFNNVIPGTYKVSAKATGKYSDFSVAKSGNFKLLGAENNIIILGEDVKESKLNLVVSDAGGLVISEFYYNLTRTEAGKAYMEDQYIHIYNNSDEVIYADGLYIGSCSVTSKNPDIFTDENFVYIIKAFKIPGNGNEHPIQPGEFIVLANDGMDHNGDQNGNPGRSVDLSGADFEFFTHGNGAFKEDIDFANVPNLELVYFYNKSWDWMPHNSHPIVVLFRTDDFDSYEKIDEYPGARYKVVKVPVTTVIDGFEGEEDGDNTVKHLPNYVTTSVFGGIQRGWKGLVCKRKVLKAVDGRDELQNTRNNNEDFETFEIYTGSSSAKSIDYLKLKKSLHPEELKMLKKISNDF